MRIRIPALWVTLWMTAVPAFAQDDLLDEDVDSAPSETAEALDEPASAAEEVPDINLVRALDRAPRAGTPLISNMLYPMQNRWELTAAFDFSYADKYVDHLGGHGALTYHILDWLAVEGFGGYLVGDETNIASKVRQAGKSANRLVNSQPCATDSCEPELPDLWQTTWFAGAALQWAPIYGKLSLVSEYDINFQLYTTLGGGVEGVRKKLNGDLNGDGLANDYLTDPAIRWNANYGVGLRFIPVQWFALRLELRNYTGMNPDVPELDARGGDECNGYTLPVAGRTDCYTDFSNNAMVQLGLSFVL